MQLDIHKKVSILIAVQNGAAWLPAVLTSLKNQTYPRQDMEVLVWDNASTDGTREAVSTVLGEELSLFVQRSERNIGLWAGFEKLFPQSHGEYIVVLTDVVLDAHFIENALRAMDADASIGALQAKIYQLKSPPSADGELVKSHIFDTTGFALYRSRRIINRGQGIVDTGQLNNAEEIFAVEGAVPVFRRSALEDSRVDGHVMDPLFRLGSLSYGDDLDLPWRMHLFGWKQWYDPSVIAYHYRSTTHGTATVPIIGQLRRRMERKKIPIQKRQLDWINTRFTIIKNDYIINILRDMPRIILRECSVLGYILFFEPAVLTASVRFFRLLPAMIRARRQIMGRAKIDAHHMRAFITS